ncbi:hypothetical protein Tco_0930996 [Tanacetum coccineum]
MVSFYSSDIVSYTMVSFYSSDITIVELYNGLILLLRHCELYNGLILLLGHWELRNDLTSLSDIIVETRLRPRTLETIEPYHSGTTPFLEDFLYEDFTHNTVRSVIRSVMKYFEIPILMD